jgi:23S rRNA pseudouridine1911/1915/1917 synthase
VTAVVAGLPRLDVWLSEREGISRHQAQLLISAGRVTVNGVPGRRSTRVTEADVVALTVAPEAVAPEPVGRSVELVVVHEDDWLAVIDKPAGLVVHPAPGHPDGTLADGLRQRGTTWSLLGGAERPGIVHRLDRDTSGLLVVAKTEQAHRHLSAQLTRRTLGRTYWALIHGGLAEQSGTVDAPVGRDPRDRKRMAVVDSGRPAVTEFSITARHRRSTELDVDLRTGRTHQIRVHLAYIGHPVVGDPLYGRQPAPRLALHARELRFDHPDGSGQRRFSSALPAELVTMQLDAAEGRL